MFTDNADNPIGEVRRSRRYLNDSCRSIPPLYAQIPFVYSSIVVDTDWRLELIDSSCAEAFGDQFHCDNWRSMRALCDLKLVSGFIRTASRFQTGGFNAKYGV